MGIHQEVVLMVKLLDCQRVAKKQVAYLTLPVQDQVQQSLVVALEGREMEM